MDDLISTQESVAKIIDTAIRKILSGEQKLTKEYEQSVIETVDVILDTVRRTEQPIIRCKDCKHYMPYEWMWDDISRSSDINDYAPDEMGCERIDHHCPPDGFCCFAERKPDEIS